VWLSSAGIAQIDGTSAATGIPRTRCSYEAAKRSRQIRCVKLKAVCCAVAAACITAVCVVPLRATPQGVSQSGVSIEISPQLFAVMCALDAAGFDANAGSLANFPQRAALRRRMLQAQGPAADALRQFYHDHQRNDPGETLSRFISFALVVGPPPRFSYQLDHDLLPPDVLSLEGFDEILANFYKEANLSREWLRVSEEYNREVDSMEPPVRRALFVAAGYLRELMTPAHGRTFTVYVEPLAGARTNFRNYGDHYSIVVGAGSQIPIDDIRHAYLHFMIDPLVLQSRMQIEKKRDLLYIAAKAPLLPREYRDDFIGLWDECSVKAVELRLRKMNPAELEEALAENDRDGYVLVRPIVEQLKLFEKAGPALHYYYPELVKGIDADEEKARLKNVKFTPSDNPAPQPVKKPAATAESDLDKDLDEGEHQIALKNGVAAEGIFEAILATNPDLPRAEYGLAIACVLQGKASQGQEIFEHLAGESKSGDAATADPAILAWSHVYLGRILDLEGDRDLALAEYDAALAVAGAPEVARAAAQRGQSAPYNASGSGKGSEEQKP